VPDAIAAGKTTAIYYAGSIEQNGPGMALGKQVFAAHYLGPKIADCFKPLTFNWPTDAFY